MMTAALTLYDCTQDDFAAMMPNVPGYRLTQLWDGLYTQMLEPKDISPLPADLRSLITSQAPPALIEVQRAVADDGDTLKFLWHLVNGNHPIETVLMYYEDRATVCVSTQAGCAMACGFCATGQAGFTRHLTAGEIIEQVVRCAREAKQHDRRIDNIVFMGMGEPLANVAPVWAAVERIHGDIGISARHITVSTVGIIPGIRTLTEWPLPVNLAVSLHAARNDLRDELVPINKRYPIDDLINACRDYLTTKNRRVTFEWALIANVNDTDRDARELADLCHRLQPSAHVNLIPLNPTPGWPTTGSSPRRVREFRDLLRELGVNATVRNNRGTDIAAACGQLAAGQPVVLRSTPA
jgi:23S rRNA (adenine2503-C2)-methyltransferase